MAKHLGIVVLSLFGFLVAPITIGAQQAVILYVSRNDSTCGGQSPCFTTIQSAINAAGPGKSIHIQAGTYPEQLTFTGKNNFLGATDLSSVAVEDLASGGVIA
jgi:hypothetical protein